MRARRIAAFLLLVVAGVLVLEWLRGGEDSFPVPPRPSAAVAPRPEPRPSPGQAPQVRAVVSGPFTTEETVVVAGPQGRELVVPRFTMSARDSRPAPGDRQELEDAVTSFMGFSLDEGGAVRVRETARLECRRMLVGLDPRGQLRVDRTREVLMEGVVLTAEGEGGLSDLVLATERMGALVEGAELRFHTAGEGDPFTATFRAGGRAWRMEGRGLSGTAPAGDEGAAGPLSLRAERDVALVSLDEGSEGGVRASVGGPLTYRGLAGGGEFGLLELAGGLSAHAVEDGRETAVQGESLRLLLRRLPGEAALPLEGTLSGNPARLTLGGTPLGGRRLRFATRTGGGLQAVVAEGSPFLELHLPGAETPSRVRAERSIHALSLPSLVGPELLDLGLPGGPPGLPSHWVFFRGRTWTEGDGEASVEADGGLVAAGAGGEEDALWLAGKGPCRVVLSEGAMTGDEGFLLVRNPGGALRLRLGPEEATAQHGWRGWVGPAALEGRGPLHLQREGAGLRLAASDPGPTGTLRVALQQAGGPATVLEAASSLEATFTGGVLEDLVAEGRGLRVADPSRGLRMEGTVLRMEAGRARLEGAPALLEQGDPQTQEPGFVLRAPRITLSPQAAGAPQLGAEGGVALELHAVEGLEGERASMALACEELETLPFLLPAEALAVAAWPLPLDFPPQAATWGGMGPQGRGWFLARGRVEVEVRSEGEAVRRFQGSALLASADTRALLLEGPRAGFLLREEGGGEVRGEASRIARDGDQVVVGDPAGDGGAILWLSGKDDLLGPAAEPRQAPGGTVTRLDCTRPIHVAPHRIWTAGPAEATTLDAALHPVPGGLHLVCQGLEALRAVAPDPEAGRIRSLVAMGPLVLTRGGLVASTDHRLAFDAGTGWLALEAGTQPALLRLADVLALRSQGLAFNLGTRESRILAGTIEAGASR